MGAYSGTPTAPAAVAGPGCGYCMAAPRSGPSESSVLVFKINFIER